jgi:hypothetical protein
LVVFTVNVTWAGGNVRGFSARNGLIVWGVVAPDGVALSARLSGAITSARLKIPPSMARKRKEDVDIDHPSSL